MTRKELLEIKDFVNWCGLEYGISFDDLKSMRLWDLIDLMISWFKTHYVWGGPTDCQREKVRQCILNRSLHD